MALTNVSWTSQTLTGGPISNPVIETVLGQRVAFSGISHNLSPDQRDTLSQCWINVGP